MEAKESEANISNETPEPKMTIEVETEEGPLSCSGDAFFHGMLAGAQEEIEQARPQLMSDAASLPEGAFNWDWKNENHSQWHLPYFTLANDEYYADETLPLCLHLSDSVFAPFLSPTYCRKSYQQVYKKLTNHLKSIDTEPSSIPLDLPD